ncbi:hypothetical protein A8H26_02695 [Pluralibacter gergoviae]|nr:hypothetical protein A8H26_02695 [Pluralibacter gergoviae]
MTVCSKTFSTKDFSDNYRFLSCDYDIWFICQFMTAIGFFLRWPAGIFATRRTFVDSLNTGVK